MIRRLSFPIALHLLFAGLFVMAGYFFKERLFADASYYFFHAINAGFFHVEHGRIVLALSQILPILGSYLGLGMKSLLIMASLGHVLFYYVLFIILLHGLKDRAGAILIILLQVCGQIWLYYSPMLEICYGAALCVLFYSMLKHQAYEVPWKSAAMVLIAWFVLSSHPENFVLYLFVIAYDVINRGFLRKVHPLFLAVFVLLLLLELLTFSEYEAGKMGASTGLAVGLDKLAQASYFAALIRTLSGYFYEAFWLWMLSISWFLIKRKWRHAFLLLFTMCGLVILVNLNANAVEFTRYYESMYNPVWLIGFLPFFYEMFKHRSKWMPLATLAILALIYSSRVNMIAENGQMLSQRVHQLENLIDRAQEEEGSKFLLNRLQYQKDYSHVAWSNPIETLLFSTMDGKEEGVSIATIDDLEYKDNARQLRDTNYIFRAFEIVPHDFLRPSLFQLKEGSYQYLNSSQSSINLDLLQHGLQVKITASAKWKSAYEPSSKQYLPIRIENTSGLLLPSAAENQFFLSYHWNKEGESVVWDGIRTAFEVDVRTLYQQDILVEMPSQAGNYELILDVVKEGERWMGPYESVELEVR